MRSRVSSALGRTRWAALPGVALAFVLWLVTYLSIDYAAHASSEMDVMWQSLGRAALTNDPVASIAVLHTQPPGLSVLYAIDLALTPDRHLVIAGLYLLVMLASIVMIVDTLLRMGTAGPWAVGAGVGYALLPATVVYSLWVYSVTPVAALCLASVWGLALMRRHVVSGLAVSAFAMLALVLLRPSFLWVVLIAWCVALTFLVVRSVPRSVRVRALAVVWLAAVLGVGVQLHYWVSFGLPTMTSWSGENLAKALRASDSLVITEGAVLEAAKDPCLAAMLSAYREDRLNRWDIEAFRGVPECRPLPALADRGTAAWDSATKAGSGDPNFNYGDRLVASRKWTELMSIVVRNDPQQLVRMALTSQYGPRSAGIGLYLSAAEDYPFVTFARDGLPTAVPAGLLSVVVAPAMWVLILLGWLHAAAVRTSRLRRSPPFWFGSALAAFHLVTNVLLEYSENMRYQAEIDGVLVLLGVMALAAIWEARPAAPVSEPVPALPPPTLAP